MVADNSFWDIQSPETIFVLLCPLVEPRLSVSTDSPKDHKRSFTVSQMDSWPFMFSPVLPPGNTGRT